MIAIVGAMLALSACATQQAPVPYAPVATPYDGVPPGVATVPQGVVVPYGPPAIAYAPPVRYYDADPYYPGPVFGAATLNAWANDNLHRFHYRNARRGHRHEGGRREQGREGGRREGGRRGEGRRRGGDAGSEPSTLTREERRTFREAGFGSGDNVYRQPTSRTRGAGRGPREVRREPGEARREPGGNRYREAPALTPEERLRLRQARREAGRRPDGDRRRTPRQN